MTEAKTRPLSPHLSIYKPTITMTMSIVHRITGMGLYAGTLLLAIWLIAAASGAAAFAHIKKGMPSTGVPAIATTWDCPASTG